MSEFIFQPLPFEILDLILAELSARDLVALSYCNKNTQYVVFPLIVARYEPEANILMPLSKPPPSTQPLVLRLTKQNLCGFLYAIHTAPRWFYQTYPILSIICTFPLDIDAEPIVHHLIRLESIMERTKVVKRLAMDFADHTLRLWYGTTLSAAETAQFDTALREILILAVKKGCTELEVINLETKSGAGRTRRRHLWTFNPKRMVGSLVNPFLVLWKTGIALRPKLTEVVGSSALMTNPFTKATFLVIINSSTLTSLSIDLNCHGYTSPGQGTALATIKVPSLRSFTLTSTYIDTPTFEAFLIRHRNITHLTLCGMFFSSGPSMLVMFGSYIRLAARLDRLEQLTCTAQLLSYFLHSMDDCLPNMRSVTMTFYKEFREDRLNQWLGRIRTQLGKAPSLGIRTQPERTMILDENIGTISPLREHVTRLELYLSAHTDASHLDNWLSFPKVNYVKFWGPENGDLVTPRGKTELPVPTNELLLRVANHPKILQVAIGDRVYDMKEVDTEALKAQAA